ncbi:hypothetical protein HN51_065772 [Arachis hypogaea]|uniref:PGG domain-containing protein n=1 Tax=Arachis hypogaea TaxID=3818 RepID=A0A444ZHK9_ARAHY|nr:uncharacterized protein DS421_14g460010 [Arachis hypogaea]RYR13541.1 hypothetical protein Ahy_B04g070477 [Arachis hypogaea]
MKSTAQNCMLISTVIATGVFAASITIPGGLDDKSGKPNYLKKPPFLVFAISDAVAFISSAAAILIFLSILVSRYAESDFYKSLPLKLIFGLVALFCSIKSMMQLPSLLLTTMTQIESQFSFLHLPFCQYFYS